MDFKDIKELGIPRRNTKDFPKYKMGDVITPISGNAHDMVDNLSPNWDHGYTEAYDKVGVIDGIEHRRITLDGDTRLDLYSISTCNMYLWGAWDFEESWDLNSVCDNSDFEIEDLDNLNNLLGM